MRRDLVRLIVPVLALGFLARPVAVDAQQAPVHRVGVVLQGGPYAAAIEGLRDALGELGFHEGTQFVLDVRNAEGDLASVETAARSLEQEKIELIYGLGSSVTAAAKRATKNVPIVFYAGSDPVALGLIENFRKPGGRLSGIYGGFSDLTGKRIELLKELIRSLRRVVTFYNPDNPAARQSLEIARDAARVLKLELLERPVASVEDLHAALRALRPGEADGFSVVSDAMVISQTESIIETARTKRLPTMFQDRGSVDKGALAAYGESYYAIGRFSARHVHRILLGADPGNLPIERIDRLHFVINLKTAKELGIAISESIIARADEVIE
jgi:putative tryptophan/tyrosine transport system substrate-binding protein